MYGLIIILNSLKRGFVVLLGLLVLALIALVFYRQSGLGSGAHLQQFWQWRQGNATQRAQLITVQREACPGAPFILPTDGFIGLLYADPNGPYTPASPHQGIDIFSDAKPGVMPVYAAYDGYVYRELTWRSALIQRIPDDPLQPGRQIWLYYAHMADRKGNSFINEAFLPGTNGVFIEKGTLLGYTGDFNGNSIRDIWVHLHFSIIQDNGAGGYANELEFSNSIDPTPYLGLPLNFACRGEVMQCGFDTSCAGS